MVYVHYLCPVSLPPTNIFNIFIHSYFHFFCRDNREKVFVEIFQPHLDKNVMSISDIFIVMKIKKYNHQSSLKTEWKKVKKCPLFEPIFHIRNEFNLCPSELLGNGLKLQFI